MSLFTLIAFAFLCAALYYICPLRLRWILLLLVSYGYYAYCGLSALPYILTTTLSTWAGALLIGRVKAAEQAGQAVREAGMPPFRAVHVSRQLPGSHVDDRDAVFRRGQSRRQRRDGMAVDQHRGRGFSLYQQTGPAHDVGQQARIGKGCRGGAQPVAGADGVVLQQGGPEGVIPLFSGEDKTGFPGPERSYRTFHRDMLQQL